MGCRPSYRSQSSETMSGTEGDFLFCCVCWRNLCESRSQLHSVRHCFFFSFGLFWIKLTTNINAATFPFYKPDYLWGYFSFLFFLFKKKTKKKKLSALNICFLLLSPQRLFLQYSWLGAVLCILTRELQGRPSSATERCVFVFVK